ncbi:bifunctional folylpolyglutamate synthase/dihydrofolate synthase [Metabacillus iocasae]|uniref:tetrahydrofolate synthase n=1 Tax=Priestia iocasae TaxID=2291674 RepID=A0ABS2QPL6_9BACI|nr:folylpolyglutamate synthase/dihydrofolate synthase family protein [Metabacillus iocasae]MBM7701345.1 dihydrofolate synthase/folylpolyglutamate synthase [Metabacillus iocasae]
MITTYEQALNWIHHRFKFGMKLGLERMEWMLTQLGNPHHNIRTVHVAGTNGKGSTVSYLRNILQQAGYRVGTFTSPYIETFNERISVNGVPISNDEMIELVNEVKSVVDAVEETEYGAPTEFEVITLMSFLYFGKKNEMDYVIYEVGLGGRFDSTNVIQPILTIITNIGFDHMNILGNTVEQITSEKAGIVKQGIPLITAVEQEGAKAVIQHVVEEHRAPLYQLGRDLHIERYETLTDGERFTLQTPFQSLSTLELSMFGYHQVKNASLATTAALYLKSLGAHIEDENIYKGLRQTKWNGRFEQVRTNPLTIIDGAHNPEGIESLLSTLRLHYEDRNIHIIFSCLKDKESKEMIASLESIAASITFTSFEFERAATGQALYEVSNHERKQYVENWQEAIEIVTEQLRDEKDVLIITGSLYFISQIRGSFL